MKRAVILVVCMFGLSTPALAFKAAYIDMQSAIQSTSAGKAAKKQLEGAFNKKKKQLKQKEEGIKKEAQAFEKKRAVLSEKKRAEKQTELQQKMMAFQQELQKSQLDIQKKEQELTRPILQKLQKTIASIAKEKGYSMVFERAANGVMYAEAGLDITDTVIKRFEKKKK